MRSFALLSLISFLVPFHAHGLTERVQVWSFNTIRGPIDQAGKWDYSFELQPRFDLSSSTRTRILLRPSVIYTLDSHQSLWFGILDLTDADFSMLEFRPWEQYLRIDRIGPSTMTHRIRLEERLAKGSADTGLRLRYLLRIQFPIDQTPWSIATSDEIFLGLNENRSQPVKGFDQNRLFAGFRRELENQMSVEIGYLNQHTGSVMNHALFLGFAKTILRN